MNIKRFVLLLILFAVVFVYSCGPKEIIEVKLPEGKTATKVTCDGREVSFETSTVEEGRYVDFQVTGAGQGKAAIAI